MAEVCQMILAAVKLELMISSPNGSNNSDKGLDLKIKAMQAG